MINKVEIIDIYATYNKYIILYEVYRYYIQAIYYIVAMNIHDDT